VSALPGTVGPRKMEHVSHCDVLIAGSGAGGFAAALTARIQGLDVIMVEKEPLFGGTTAYSAGVIWIPGNSYQKAAGVADTREAALCHFSFAPMS
jgi:succinate dehydrogenase/fumarate reductase flavoprotein subunit